MRSRTPVPPIAFDLLSDRYRIERELGRGGMATVYLAQDLRHHRQVAIKVLLPEIAAAIGRDRFLREIEIAAGLTHPHIVPLFDSGAAGDALYYVMPYIAGESLRARLAQSKQLPLDDALRLTREIASALGHAHQRGLVHRDIKPENILLLEGMALVADFGIARSTGTAMTGDATQLATMAGAVLGTPQYMSPEQASGREADQRSDVYALACVLFEMLTGEPPFVAQTPDALLRMHVTVEPRPVTDIRPATPAAIAYAVAKGLAKLPADRFSTAAQFAAALAAGLTDSTPAAPALTATKLPGNLPRPRTHFIGRARELAECVRLLGETRVLTLTGIGGGGKTRLALRLAEETRADYPDGTWFVDLAPLADADRVVNAIAVALGVREAPDRELGASLGEFVQGKRLLLLLDNCEHLLSAVGDTVDRLLGMGDDIRILVTSREGMGIEGERLFALGSLAGPPSAARDTAAVAASDAAQLFVDRAQQVVPDFVLDDDTAAAVADICRRLDGIPLAIELAAARVKVLSLEQIRRRLDDRFRLLTGGSRSALPRHQTLHATIQWSYDQLTPDEQQLLCALSVFSGGWTLEVAAKVLGDRADEFEVLDLLSRLVDKSLLLVGRDENGDPRYRLLETVRQYAAERLAAGGNAEGVRQRHADAFLAIAERAYDERVRREGAWSAMLEVEHDNLRTALAFVRARDPEQYLTLAGALAWFWQARTHLLEGREHLAAALAGSPAAPARRTRARALWGAAALVIWQGDAAASLRGMEDALQMYRDLGDTSEIGPALEGIGWAQFFAGEDDRARATFDENLRLQRAAGDPHMINRAKVALAQVLVALERVTDARAHASEIIAFSAAHHDRRSEHSGWHYLADCALLEGECRESLSLYRRSLALAQSIGDRIEIGFEVQGVAMSLAGTGEAERALRLAASVEAEWVRIGASIRLRFWDALLERYLGAARTALGPVRAAAVWTAGRDILFDDAVTTALDGWRL